MQLFCEILVQSDLQPLPPYANRQVGQCKTKHKTTLSDKVSQYSGSKVNLKSSLRTIASSSSDVLQLGVTELHRRPVTLGDAHFWSSWPRRAPYCKRASASMNFNLIAFIMSERVSGMGRRGEEERGLSWCY